MRPYDEIKQQLSYVTDDNPTQAQFPAITAELLLDIRELLIELVDYERGRQLDS